MVAVYDPTGRYCAVEHRHLGCFPTCNHTGNFSRRTKPSSPRTWNVMR